MVKKFFYVFFLCSFCFAAAGAFAGVTNYPGLITADYWIKQNAGGDKVILNAAEIKSFNASVIKKNKEAADLETYPQSVSGAAVKSMLSDYTLLEETVYLNGRAVSDSYKDILRRQTNVSAVPKQVTTKWGVTVKRANMRNLPTGESLFFYPKDKEFDILQETALDPGEGVAILHQSANGFFYFVQSVNYRGWISKFDIALTDRATWLKYVKPDDFLVVTGREFTKKAGGSALLYQQGAKLPLTGMSEAYYKVLVPMRAGGGNLIGQEIFIDKQEPALHRGYLPYTSNNIIRSAFKFYGAPYGWGGLKNSVDCSSLVYNAYRTVGIYLSRNADQQENGAGRKHRLAGLTDSQRKELISRLTPGAALYMEDHTAVYIGQLKGEPYVIHSLGSYFAQDNFVRAMSVVVSDLSLQRGNRVSFLQSLTTGVEFK